MCGIWEESVRVIPNALFYPIVNLLPRKIKKRYISINLQSGFLQAVVTYKYSDNITRTRVSTINLDYLRENHSV